MIGQLQSIEPLIKNGLVFSFNTLVDNDSCLQIIGEKDADGFYWGECGGRSGYVPCNMVSEVQVDDERVARELLKDDQRMRGGRGGWRGGDRWGDIYAGASTKKMIALYDYDPMELSPNVDMEVSFYCLFCRM